MALSYGSSEPKGLHDHGRLVCATVQFPPLAHDGTTVQQGSVFH
jgi:hypothetical protein